MYMYMYMYMLQDCTKEKWNHRYKYQNTNIFETHTHVWDTFEEQYIYILESWGGRYCYITSILSNKFITQHGCFFFI